MNKRAETGLAIVIGIALLALSSGYDFWRGYHEEHSIEGGVIFVVFGFVLLGIIAIVHSVRGK